ncbi:hypothetical protein [Enhygromyxa salina]|uniref:hypothetical protein n=1 Tax=Enhygromyxa salina TaxID=215803 RepID=UPI0011B276AB|nr:hypothetical protein [Enhygromyxa salina]
MELLIDTSELEPTLGERLSAALELLLPDALREHGLEVVRGGAAVTVEVRLTMPDVGLHEYVISIDVLTDGAREVVVDAKRCLACSEQKVVDRVIEQLPTVADWRPKSEPRTPCVKADSRATVVPVTRRPLRLGGLGLTGAVSLSAGAATIGGGVLMMSMPNLGWNVDPRPVGMGLVVGGSAVAAVAVAMVAVDVVLLAGRKRKPSMSVLPSLSPTNGGVLVVGRF